jgi:hypothetical protein
LPEIDDFAIPKREEIEDVLWQLDRSDDVGKTWKDVLRASSETT